MAISISMQFEADGQPPNCTDSPHLRLTCQQEFRLTRPPTHGLLTATERVLREGWTCGDRHGVKVTSHMIGDAAQRQPALAKEIVQREHEAAGYGSGPTSVFLEGDVEVGDRPLELAGPALGAWAWRRKESLSISFSFRSPLFQ